MCFVARKRALTAYRNCASLATLNFFTTINATVPVGAGCSGNVVSRCVLSPRLIVSSVDKGIGFAVAQNVGAKFSGELVGPSIERWTPDCGRKSPPLFGRHGRAQLRSSRKLHVLRVRVKRPRPETVQTPKHGETVIVDSQAKRIAGVPRSESLVLT